MKKIIIVVLPMVVIALGYAFYPNKARCSQCKPFACERDFDCDGSCECEKRRLSDDTGICVDR